MNQKLEEVLTPEEINKGKRVVEVLVSSIKTVIRAFFSSDMEFIVIMRAMTKEQSMLIMGDVEDQTRMSSIIKEAYERHNNGSMNIMGTVDETKH